MMEPVTTIVLDGFDDPRLGRERWNALLRRGKSNVVFLTWEWQRAWWDSFDRTGLMLIVAMREGEPAALAPFFAEEGKIYFVGSGGSDYLDFIGDFTTEGIMEALLSTAMERTSDFSGFLLYHILQHSPSGAVLRRSAFQCTDEPGLPAPALDLNSDTGRAAPQKKSLVRHEKLFQRDANLEVLHLRAAADIEPRLETFFAQHIERWSGTESPSLFRDEAQRRFYRALTMHGTAAGWLRFTELRWKEKPIAFHFGVCYDGTYLWYKPTFDIALARMSPGEVALRRLLLAAIDEGAHTFDFGLGDEPFKRRFATHIQHVRNWTIALR